MSEQNGKRHNEIRIPPMPHKMANQLNGIEDK